MRLQQVGLADERGHELVRAPVELGRRTDLQQAALLHHADPVRQLEGFLLVVRDQDRRDLQRTLNVAQCAPELTADLDVQRAEGLVEQEHGRLEGQRPRDGDTLLLAARELARKRPAKPGQAHEGQ